MKKENLFTIAPKIKPKYILLLAGVLMLSYLFTGCKKKNDTPSPNNNEIKATVVISPTTTITINATGSNAVIGPSLFGGGTYIDGYDASNAAIRITTGTTIVTIPGTYSFTCIYTPNLRSGYAPIYGNNGTNSGSVTFMAVNDYYMEGYFNAVCRNNMDSVIVSGTFKGDHLTH